MDDQRGDAVGKSSERGAPASVDRIELPKQASAYYSPKPPPATTQHRTVEVEAVRIDPAMEYELEDTQRMQVDELPQVAVDRHAPTVLLPAVRLRRQRALRPWVVAAIIALSGIVAFLVVVLLSGGKTRRELDSERAAPPGKHTRALAPVPRGTARASEGGNRPGKP